MGEIAERINAYCMLIPADGSAFPASQAVPCFLSAYVSRGQSRTLVEYAPRIRLCLECEWGIG